MREVRCPQAPDETGFWCWLVGFFKAVQLLGFFFSKSVLYNSSSEARESAHGERGALDVSALDVSG